MLYTLAMMPGVKARSINQGHPIKKLPCLAVFDCHRIQRQTEIFNRLPRPAVLQPIFAGELRSIHITTGKLRRLRCRFVLGRVKIAEVEPVTLSAEMINNAVVRPF